jgi:hypothetical protein
VPQVDQKLLLIDNICVSFGGILFHQVVGIPMGTNCAPLLADLFLYSYESDFLQKLVKDKKIHEARAYRYIDDVLSINNSRFAELLPLIYPPELEVKENRLEEGHNSYPLVCRRPGETVSLQRRHICYQ